MKTKFSEALFKFRTFNA